MATCSALFRIQILGYNNIQAFFRKGVFRSILILFISSFSTALFAQYGYFYTGKPYGSELALSPATQILNGGFDMLQTTNYVNSLEELKVFKGMKGAYNSLTHPRKAIERIGWKKFANSELIPFGFSKTNSQWLPNYGLHLLGGGMEYARMSDYFDYHGFKHPRLWAAMTALTEQFMNESVEMHGRNSLNYTVVSDFYFFNIPGLILFSFEPVQRFFSTKIIVRSWLGQASFIPSDVSLRNTGQYYSLKIQPGFTGRFSFLYYMGAGWLNGVGYDRNEMTYSIAVGAKTEEVYIIDEETEQEFIKLAPSAAFFIDRNNSLLFSAVVTTHRVYEENIRLDLFPGILKIGDTTIGLWTNISFAHQSYFGITFRGLPGIGF